MISENFEKLFEAAKLVRQRAHVPYSNFKVGAAFLTNDGSIISNLQCLYDTNKNNDQKIMNELNKLSTGASIESGSITITGTNTNHMVIDQSTDKSVINISLSIITS